MRSLDPDPDPRGQKWPRQKMHQLINFIFEVLDVLPKGVKASPVVWTSFIEAFLCNFLKNKISAVGIFSGTGSCFA
jgi:hypothetical protein